MAVFFSGMPHPTSIFAAYASISAFVMLIQTMLNQLLPHQVRHYIVDTFRRYLRPRPDRATVVIEERDGMSWNEVYAAAETYLCTKIRPSIERLKISKSCKDTALSFRFAQSQIIPDRFEEIELEWRFLNVERKRPSKVIDEEGEGIFHESEKRYFELCFDKRHKEKVLDFYVPFVMAAAKSIAAEKKVVKLHTLACASTYATSIVWDYVILEHPSTFETLAMEPGLKSLILEDLDRFVRRKDFYRKVGRAWKRGYLLYGPPGTGKSSLIAAMANYLRFDIYDLELANVKRDSDLRRLLLRTGNRSILVIEDIDCSVELPDRKGKGPALAPGLDAHGQPYRSRDHQFTLSGLLNFVDGLWSSCGDERIIIFTTNNKEKLDPALLRPGRMDMHIHMSYLTPDGFNLLASTYLDVPKKHPSLSKIKAMIKDMSVTPAEVAEELMKTDDVDVSLCGVLDFLRDKKSKIEGEKDKREKRVENGEGEEKEVSRVEGECNGELGIIH